jgi:hypothetical protein
MDHVFARLDASNVFNAGSSDRTCGVLEEIFADAALTQRLSGFGIMRRANFTGWLVGSSDTFGWFDSSNPNAGTIVNDDAHRTGGTPGAPRATYLELVAVGCGAGGLCCRADFNADGDSGTDADIEAFFRCLAGDCCLECPPDADFNCDGEAGTFEDIESFFRVLAGGSC